MRGYPKTLNSKGDFQYVMKHFPADPRWVKALRNMLATYQDWFFVKNLDSEADGIVDDTHKIVSDTDSDGNPTFMQYEFRTNEKAKIFRLGYTVEEVEALAKKGEEAVALKAGNADA